MKARNGAVLDWVKKSLAADQRECLIIPFAAGSHGYVPLWIGQKQYLLHRYVCEAAFGPAPSRSHQAAHSCGNKRCANWRHLRWATRKENEADKRTHGTVSRGTRHWASKLAESDVAAIRQSRGPQRKIARDFGIAQQTVSDIKSGRRWSWL